MGDRTHAGRRERTKMAYDPEEIGLNPRQAVFLPALQSMYMTSIVSDRTRLMFPGAAELNWYDPDNEHWTYPATLYSVGQSKLQLDDNHEKMVTVRDRSRTMLIADSGGYQIGKSTFRGYKDKITPEFLRSGDYDDLRLGILRWMEAFADYGLIIDFPAWAVGKEKFILPSVEACLNETERNCLFLRDHHSPDSAVRFLTVIQGTSYLEAVNWYNRLKQIEGFPYRGWSFAGPVGKNPIITLQMILSLWRDGRINDQENWIHILGQGSLEAAFVFNVFQQCLIDYVCPTAHLSYDVSSPFLMGSFGRSYTVGHSNSEALSLDEEPLKPDTASFITETHKRWCVWDSPFANDINFDELFVEGTKHGLDTKSYAIIMHHNLYVTHRAIKMMAFQSELEDKELTGLVPHIFIRFRRDVRKIFAEFSSVTDIAHLPISADYATLLS